MPGSRVEDVGIERRVVVGHVVAVEVVGEAVRPGVGGRAVTFVEIIGEPRRGEPVLAVGQVAQGVEDDRLLGRGMRRRVAQCWCSGPVAAGRADRSLTPCQLTWHPPRDDGVKDCRGGLSACRWQGTRGC